MKLGFDIDGVIADMSSALIEAMNSEFELDYDESIFVHHNLFKNTYVDDPELNDKIAQHMRQNVIYNKAAVSILKPYSKVAASLRKLGRQHSLHYITGRPVEQENICIEWLRKNNIPFDSVHAVGRAAKGMTGRALNLDFYIDDEMKHLKSMYKFKNRWRKGIALFRRPWNQKDNVDMSKYLVFDNWKDITRHLGIHNR